MNLSNATDSSLSASSRFGLASFAAVLSLQLAACSGTSVGTGSPGSSGNLGVGSSGSSGAVASPGPTDDSSPTQPSDDDGGTSLPAPPGGPSATPGQQRVFVTSSTYSGSFKAEFASASAPTGVLAGDALCQLSAEAAGLGGTWTAYLTDGTVYANDRLVGSGPWTGMDGKVVFKNKANLVTSPVNPLVYDELGRQAGSFYDAWVGDPASHCSTWSSGSGYGAVGQVGSTSQAWRAYGSEYCSERHRLYCFEN